MADLGLTIDDFDADYTAEFWPENELSVDVFVAMSTQWVHGVRGPTGLNYQSLSEVWRRLKVPTDRRDDVFYDLRVMEVAALNQMQEP